MYVINSVDNAELPCYTLPPTQHHTFFRKLPLFSSHHLVITVVILSTQVYQWWKSTKRVPYPSTLYVTLKGVQPPKTIDPSLRSMFAIQQVCLFFFFFSFLCEHYHRYGEHSGHYKLPTEMCSVEFKHYKEK